MPKFRVGQEVYAPIYRYPGGNQASYALAKGIVRATSNRSCDVDLPYVGLRRIASSLLHERVGVCIVRVGDFRSESWVLDPVCKSILHFLRVLLPDDQVKSVALRTSAELEELFEIYASAYNLWVIVGHGTETGQLCFTRGERRASSLLATSLAPHASAPKIFLFLSCYTGLAAFARRFSADTTLCNALIGPTSALHSAIASQFAQTFLSYLYLEGRHTKTAYRKAVANVPTLTKFRMWKDGRQSRRR